MDDPLAFLHLPRVEPGKQRAGERICHWHEYEQLLPVRQAAVQAARCMDCGTPWCHEYCPVHNLVPAWNGLIEAGRWREAWQALERTNNFPEFTGRLCPAPCEDACTLRLSGAPVTIRPLELALSERAWSEGWVTPEPPRRRRFERIAIVGSGPAGLACAQQLVRRGYRVTVYERDDRPGGLLRYGIPDFRLEKRVLDRRIRQLDAEGVVFRTGVEVGEDLPALRRRAHAVVLACGSRVPRDLEVPGRHLDGIHFAMDYLVQQNRVVAGREPLPGRRIDARGRTVAVIGGGDTGADCVGTAIRQGARSVVQIQYHEAPPPHADVLKYWPQRVPEQRLNDHDAEGCHHLWGWNTVAFEGEDGRVRAVRLQRLRWWRDADGRERRAPVPGSERRLSADLVLIAAGYAHPEHAGPVTALGLALDARGNVQADDHDCRTSVEGVFACGDMRRGQSLIVWAIQEGRRCAAAVDEWLNGETWLPRD